MNHNDVTPLEYFKIQIYELKNALIEEFLKGSNFRNIISHGKEKNGEQLFTEKASVKNRLCTGFGIKFSGLIFLSLGYRLAFGQRRLR